MSPNTQSRLAFEFPYTSIYIYMYVFIYYGVVDELLIVVFVVQRCKHFEIGGDKKGKGTSLF